MKLEVYYKLVQFIKVPKAPFYKHGKKHCKQNVAFLYSHT